METVSSEQWAKQQWQTVNLGDKRLNRRAIQIGQQIALHPKASLPEQMSSPSELEAAYRLLNNRAVTMQSLLEPHINKTLDSARKEKVVLWIEDTTELDYTRHRASKQGMASIGDGNGYGMLLHSTLAVVPHSRRLLGLGHAQSFLRVKREGNKKGKGWRGTAEGEAWQHSAQAIGKGPEQGLWVHVGDRGADIFAFMATCVELNKQFVVRVGQNRCCSVEEDASGVHLKEYVRSLKASSNQILEVDVPPQPGQAARQAQLQVAWAKVQIAPPPQAPQEIHQHNSFDAWVIRAWEQKAPQNGEAIEWILLTSLPINNFTQATEKVDWYTCRWMCEDFHQCLKSGCHIEHSQLDDAKDIERLLGFLIPTAVRLLQLRQEVRQDAQGLANQKIDEWMVKTLARLTKLDEDTMTIEEFWHHIARLGGFLWRKRDGQPGWRTIWRGWQYLSDLTAGARLFL